MPGNPLARDWTAAGHPALVGEGGAEQSHHDLGSLTSRLLRVDGDVARSGAVAEVEPLGDDVDAGARVDGGRDGGVDGLQPDGGTAGPPVQCDVDVQFGADGARRGGGYRAEASRVGGQQRDPDRQPGARFAGVA